MTKESYEISYGCNVADYVVTDNIFGALKERDSFLERGFYPVHIIQTFDGFSSYII